MRPESRALTMREIEQEICSLRIDSVSLSADAGGALSIDEITLAPRNGGRYRLVLASAPMRRPHWTSTRRTTGRSTILKSLLRRLTRGSSGRVRPNERPRP
jgi:hypothetical protein